MCIEFESTALAKFVYRINKLDSNEIKDYLDDSKMMEKHYYDMYNQIANAFTAGQETIINALRDSGSIPKDLSDDLTKMTLLINAGIEPNSEAWNYIFKKYFGGYGVHKDRDIGKEIEESGQFDDDNDDNIMEKIFEITPEYVEQMPEELKHGILYISEKYSLAIHLCACGCGIKSVTRIGSENRGWTIIKSGNMVTLTPSIGNFSGEEPYHAHYHIRNNKIEWC